MKSTIASLSLGASLVSLTAAAGTLQLGIQGKRGVGNGQTGLRKRAGSVQTTIQNDARAVSYYANITIGTPPQNIQLIVDTGSSDVWALATGDPICSTQSCTTGLFDSSKSSTFDVVGANQFTASYVDGSSTTGDYFEDTFGIGGASVKGFQMGLAYNSSIPQGIMGIAFDTAEGGNASYPNLVDQMVNQSIIATQAYSLWLDDRASSTGSLLFGGIDTKKYEGNLANIKMYPSAESEIIDRFTVAWTSLSITSPSGTDVLSPSDLALGVVLDSGTTLTYLPDALAVMVYNEVGATYSSSQGVAFCDCFTGDVQGTLNFGFAGQNGVTIKVPMAELVAPALDINGNQLTFNSGQPACIFGIGPLSSLGEGSPILFGDTLLRSAYVVYDLANFRIGLAQTDFNSTDSNVVSFPSLSAQIPSATTVADELSVSQTATGTATGVGQVPNPTITAVSTGGKGGQFTGSAGPGFATAATQTASATGKAKKGAAGREIPFSLRAVGAVAVLVGVVSQTFF